MFSLKLQREACRSFQQQPHSRNNDICEDRPSAGTQRRDYAKGQRRRDSRCGFFRSLVVVQNSLAVSEVFFEHRKCFNGAGSEPKNGRTDWQIVKNAIMKNGSSKS